MSYLKLLLTVLAASFVLTACAPANVKNAVSPEIIGGHLELSEAPTLARHGAAVEMLYYGPENQLILRHADGSEIVLNEMPAKDARRAYTVLHSDGTGLYALWRPKLNNSVEGVGGPGEKMVYFRASMDGGQSFGPVHRLNQKGGAFKPFVASNGKGDLYVVYTDERNSGLELDLYMNASHDRGASWKKEDVKLNGVESRMAVNPSVVAEGEHVYVSWMTKTYGKDFKLFVRTSEDRGETWLPPVAAHVSFTQPATPLLIHTATGLLLCWGDEDAVRCTRSTDHGRSWSGASAIEDTKGTSGLFLEADPTGHAHMLIAKKLGDDKARINLFHVYSADGHTFSKPHRLNGGPEYVASTILPTMSFGDDGSMLAVWVDMRYLRPVIAANYSRDGGNTWLKNSIVLGGRRGMFNFFPTVAYAGAGKYSVAWQETPNRSDRVTIIESLEYTPGGSAGVAMPQPDAERLKVRVDTFWRLREEGKWGEVYDLMDPFFRETNSRANYVRTQGNVKYYSHRLVGEPEINGVRGAMNVAYDSEVPELMLQGKKINIPREEVVIPQEWIWVDGDWYQVFRDLFGGSTLLD